MHLDFKLPILSGAYPLTYGCAAITDPADDNNLIEDQTVFFLYFNPTLENPFIIFRMGYHPDEADDVPDEARRVSDHNLLFDAQTAYRKAIQERGKKFAKRYGVDYDTDMEVIAATYDRIDTLKEHLANPKANVSLEDRNRLDKIEEGFSYFAGGFPRSTSKPNIDEVFSAFQRHQAACLQVTKLGVARMGAALKEAQEAFRVELAVLGLAQHIDWTDTND